jgi:hypothetical protein
MIRIYLVAFVFYYKGAKYGSLSQAAAAAYVILSRLPKHTCHDQTVQKFLNPPRANRIKPINLAEIVIFHHGGGQICQ